ncbi:MAG: RdgB/HAM1 family non-canonical purine NTP pyrophosphatase [Alphaproteobacteria bacterium]|nr:RdgB/HAM1 family non-canonical purine NTP pyrophosphatase [Alphaproteobacteria bacterium]
MLKELVIASHNKGKIAEFEQMLKPFGVKVYSALELNLPDVEETGKTFTENASLKAETLSEISGKPCLADDSGLCVDVLEGRPGVYSARYAPNRDFDKAMDMLIEEIKQTQKDDWSAHFSCVLALKEPGKPIEIFEGRVDGKIIDEKKGKNGFGFDPVFVPEGFDKTFAEMSSEEKKQISHRGRAVKSFLQRVFNGKNI